jgi:hypothetical protein
MLVSVKQKTSDVANQIVQKFTNEIYDDDLCVDTVDTPTQSPTLPPWLTQDVTTSQTTSVQMADPNQKGSENPDVEYV